MSSRDNVLLSVFLMLIVTSTVLLVVDLFLPGLGKGEVEVSGRVVRVESENFSGVTSKDANAFSSSVDKVELTPAEIYENNADAVFSILTTDDVGRYYMGTGFFISDKGIAITNHHVMAGMTEARIMTNAGTIYHVKGYYYYSTDNNDLAVIHVDTKRTRVPFVKFGDSDKMSIGKNVYALGNSEGDHQTFTPGIISRFPKDAINFGIYSVEGMIQFTAPVYGGNSGGPLFNDFGEVIGINSAGGLLEGSSERRESVGYAVPTSRIDFDAFGSELKPLPIEGKVSQKPSKFDGDMESMRYVCRDRNCEHNWSCDFYFFEDITFRDGDGDSGVWDLVHGNVIRLDYNIYTERKARLQAEFSECGTMLVLSREGATKILYFVD